MTDNLPLISSTRQCPFIGSNEPTATVCKRAKALQKLAEGVEGVFTPAELSQEVCHNPNAIAYEQCLAYLDLSQNGRASGWCR